MVSKKLELSDEILSYMEDYPFGVLYECLCRQRAMLLFEQGQQEEAIANLSESFGVTIRQRYLGPSYQSVSGISQNNNSCDRVLDHKLLEFNAIPAPDAPLGYLNRLADLPSDWTIVQVSQLDTGPHLVPPRLKTENRLKPLVICRLGCGDHAKESQICFVRRPMPMPYRNNCDLFVELKAIVDRYLSLPSFVNTQQYSVIRKEVEARYKTLLESLQQWLAEHRCLFLGRLVNPALAKAVETGVVTLGNSLKVPKHCQQALNLLVQGCAVLNDKELKNGLDTLLPESSGNRQRLLQTAAKKVRALSVSMMDQKENLVAAPRHHVILILDRVLYHCTWEMLDVLRPHPVSRMPCLAITHAMYSVPTCRRQLDEHSAYFVVDPDNNLSRTAERMKAVVQARPSWSGTVSNAPSKTTMKQALQERDIYLYCGHGPGLQLLPSDFQCNSVSLLLGCSSSDMCNLGHFWEAHGAPINFMLSGSPGVLGFLFNALDRDVDKLTLQLLETWVPPGVDDIAQYRKKLRSLDLAYLNNIFIDIEQNNNLHIALCKARQMSETLLLSGALIANGLPIVLKDCKLTKRKQ